MRKNYLLVLILLFFGYAEAQIINIPDADFKAKLISSGANADYAAYNQNGQSIAIDVNADGQIQQSEALAVYKLIIRHTVAANLEGIQYFTNLTNLDCNSNALTNLDFSALGNLIKLDCHNNPSLTSINLDGLSELKTLYVNETALTTLNLGASTKLVGLNCQHSLLQELVLPASPFLTLVSCFDNQLTTLNVSGLTALESLLCFDNSLTALDVSGLASLGTLNCYDNNLSSLNLTGTCLTNLDCNHNNLTSVVIPSQTCLTKLDCSYNNIAMLNLSGGTNLNSVTCMNNQMTALQLPSVSTLRFLYAQNNLLSAISLSGLTSLQIMNCSYNQLQALNTTGLTKLNILDCSHNAIAGLAISGLHFLQSLDCQYNGMTDLTLSTLDNLYSVDCFNNQLTVLTLTGLPKCNTIKCNNNLLQTIDVSSLGKLEILNCAGNPALVSVFAKTGSPYNMTFFSCPNLQYICTNDQMIDDILLLVTQYGYTGTNVNSYCSFVPGGNFYTLQGNVRYDLDGNGCTSGNIFVPNAKFTISSGPEAGSTYTNLAGGFNFPLQAGSYTITPAMENPYFTISPTAATVNFPAQASPAMQDFCVSANGVHPDLEIAIIPTRARAGFDLKLRIVYKNKGTHVQSGTVSLTFDDPVTDLLASNPAVTSQLANILSWNFTNLQPLESRLIRVVFHLNSPMDTPALNTNDILHYTATVTSAQIDQTPEDNISSFDAEVRNSFDPNDKTCLEGDSIAPDMAGKYVHYTIRFENTGTAQAKNIVVADQIDAAKFDIASLMPMAASHPFITRVSGAKVEFIFKDIDLPFDAGNNDGFVSFKIKTKESLVSGDFFSNTAAIYFDYNFPVITNTATTMLQVLGRPDFAFTDYFTLYPNPAAGFLNIQTQKGVELASVSIYNALGQLVIAIPNAQQANAVDVSGLSAGSYFIRIGSDKGNATAKFIKQ